ncbi:c-type cytochrome [Noviherbaspirillum soli]|uniref:c-type cytochrome n=1 Tax=Noviherbaspirillum soli TaxID=1064518 RepID=UPI00188BBF0F|nr:cytochrome c [Noviherbaspirillum soli]
MRRNKLAPVVLLAAVFAAASSPLQAADMAAAKGKAGQCFVCHGADGLAKVPDAPNLAGQNEGYLIKALKDYKSGKRENEMMNAMAKNLSDQDIALVAAYFSGIAITVKAP